MTSDTPAGEGRVAERILSDERFAYLRGISEKGMDLLPGNTGELFAHIAGLQTRLRAAEGERDAYRISWFSRRKQLDEVMDAIDAAQAEVCRLTEDLQKHKDDRSYWAARCHETVLEVRRLRVALTRVRKIISPHMIGQAECDRIDAALAPQEEPTR